MRDICQFLIVSFALILQSPHRAPTFLPQRAQNTLAFKLLTFTSFAFRGFTFYSMFAEKSAGLLKVQKDPCELVNFDSLEKYLQFGEAERMSINRKV